jgi:hypothetical protein
MRISSLILGLVWASVAISQEAGNKALITRVYDGNDFAGYSLDPPYWSYHLKGFWHSKSAHWLYGNHRRVFIDIKLTGMR